MVKMHPVCLSGGVSVHIVKSLRLDVMATCLTCLCAWDIFERASDISPPGDGNMGSRDTGNRQHSQGEPTLK